MPAEYVFPIRPTVYPNESILGYLKRLAKVLELSSVDDLAEKAGLPKPLKDATITADPAKLASSLGDGWRSLKAAHMRPEGARYNYGGNILPREYLYLDGMLICGECVKEQPYHRHFWHLLPIGVCHIHGTALHNVCLDCGTTLTWNSPGITTCHKCHSSITTDEGLRLSDVAMRAAQCLLHIGGFVPSTDLTLVPPVLRNLSLADTIAFLDFLGRLSTSNRAKAKAKNKFLLPQFVAAGYAIAVEWPASIHSALTKLEKRNKRRGTTPPQIFQSYYDEGINAPFTSWGGRIQAAFIRYLAYRDDLKIDVRHHIWDHIFKMRTYCPEEEVLETLRVSKEQLQALRRSSEWNVEIHHAEGREWFKFGHVVELRERLTKDPLGYHTRYRYPTRNYEWRTPLTFGIPGMTMRTRKNPAKEQT